MRTPHARAAYLLEHFWDAMVSATRCAAATNASSSRASWISFRLSPRRHRALARPCSVWCGAPEPTRKRVCWCSGWRKVPLHPRLADAVRGVFHPFPRSMGPHARHRRRRKDTSSTPAGGGAENRPGSTAADLRFRTHGGAQGTLHGIGCERLLLLFYNPDCTHCTETIRLLDGNEAFRAAVRSGRLGVAALCAGEERAAWGTHERGAAEGLDRGVCRGGARGDGSLRPARKCRRSICSTATNACCSRKRRRTTCSAGWRAKPPAGSRTATACGRSAGAVAVTWLSPAAALPVGRKGTRKAIAVLRQRTAPSAAVTTRWRPYAALSASTAAISRSCFARSVASNRSP